METLTYCLQKEKVCLVYKNPTPPSSAKMLLVPYHLLIAH